MKSQVLFDLKPSYLPLTTSYPHSVLPLLKQELDTLDSSAWFHDDYREVSMCTFFSGAGASKTKKEVQSSRKHDLVWTMHIEKTPLLKSFIENHLWPLLDKKGRITILKTLPGKGLKGHFDCSKSEVNSYQPKLRIALSGDVRGLFFFQKKYGKNRKVKLPLDHSLYLINGSSPHGMINESQETKYTICLGSPWSGEFSNLGHEKIKESLSLYQNNMIPHQEIDPKDPENFYGERIPFQILS